ncbi:MAG TPA: lytic transglycosylase domain-containing protein [Solirubrobacteraceae bacterium]|jgi:soluble lytic murein transglycosylase|nr:lytic transglycosylase domain-containing protein [Solirubrobacteraceae bacterium]
MLVAAVGVVLVVIAVVLAMPLFRKAVNELMLPLSYQNVIRQQAAAKHLDPALIAAVIDAETKFDPSTSSAGAVGLMQILPQTAEYLARKSDGYAFTPADLATPAVNIAYGSYYLRELLDHYGGNELLAIAAYNGGETNVDSWLTEARADGHRFVVGDIPFPETRAYVQRVLQAQKDYRRTYPSQLGYS